MNELDLFAAAIAITDPAKRAELLDRECAGRVDLRQRLDLLLAAHAQSHPMLDRTDPVALNATTAYTPAAPLVGVVIAGRYKLLEEIGDGGMGTVWMAEQREPVKRLVALKLIKPGMDSRSVLARFEAERQALALMDHPNIAKVHDGGTTAEGRPFFVMELVKGLPLTQYCDARRLSIRDRLELFGQVCSAVQHAHQKGVIHRDLKPSNVLVTEHDGKPVPKVIDFGLAKALNAASALTDKTLHTGFGAVVGTPLYMAPEQVGINALDVDTRTDVYALGVILYELLTGTTPLEKGRLREAAWDEMRRLIREEEPPRPSTRLSTSVALPSLAAGRQIEPARLTKLVRGELDWIVMKALEKDRNRRYETANLLAADVQRHLTGEPVLAVPPSAGYRLRKFARKHRAILTTVAAFAGLLIAAAVVSGWLALKARRAEGFAEDKRIEAENNLQKAEESFSYAVNATSRALIALSISEVNKLDLQVDFDLAELRTDPRAGLLRLARPMKTESEPIDTPFMGAPDAKASTSWSNNPQFLSLREFVTVAVLALGQDYAPLLPPITHDGQSMVAASLSADNKTLLTLGADFTARLWDARTGQPIAILRKESEKVVSADFSADGRTVFTDDQTSVARFWDVSSGRIRAATEARPNRYVARDNVLSDASHFQHMGAAYIGTNRLLTQRVVEKVSGNPGSPGGSALTQEREGPLELWDVATGRLVSKLEVPRGAKINGVQFLGEWVVVQVKDGDALLVFSGENDRLLGRIPREKDESLQLMDASPNGRQLAIVFGRGQGSNLGTFENRVLRVGDVATGQIRSSTTVSGNRDIWQIQYLMDDAFGGSESVVALGGDNGWTVFRVGRDEPIAEFSGVTALPDLLGRAGDVVHSGNGRLYDARTWQRLYPPPGRKFHTDLAKFAADGRFVRASIGGDEVMIDTRADKVLPIGADWANLPGSGMITCTLSNPEGTTTIRLLPSATSLNIPADLLELWAQVAVRGELNADGRFVKWDEDTWERKRQELAAKPAPHPNFPFPGHVATDKLHWLRAEFDEAKTDADKLGIARELLRRAELVADRVEAVRWRAEVAQRSPELAPPPREVK